VIRDVVAGAVQASEQAGTSLAASARSIAKGIMLGVNEVGGNIAAAATETVRTVVKHATAVGTDVSAIARNTVAGVVDATIETGRDVTHIAATSVKDAIKASGRIGSRTARRVENILAGVVRGAKEAVNVAPAPAPGGRTTKVTARAGAPARKAPAKKLANRLAA
jgi:hypothetical protein